MISAAIAMASLYVLVFKEKKLDRSGSQSELAGQVRRLSNDVRVRASGSLAWFSIDDQADVFYSDSIFTGERSQAGVQTASGELTLDPATLLVLEKTDTGPVLDLKSGTASIKLKKGESIPVRSEGREVKITAQDQNSVIRLDRADTGTNVQIVTGRAQLSEALSESPPVEVAPGETVSFKKDIALKVEAAKMRLLEPSVSAPVVLDKNKTVNFKWDPSDVKGPYWFFVSRDPMNKSRVVSVEAVSPQTSVKLPDDALLYWKITSNQGDHSIMGVIETISLAAPVLILPPNEFSISGGTDRVSFSWRDKQSARTYKFQVSAEQDFKSPVIDVETTNSNLQLDLSKMEGALYWRVKVADTDSPLNSFWSEARRFKIEKSKVADKVISPTAGNMPVVSETLLPVEDEIELVEKDEPKPPFKEPPQKEIESPQLIQPINRVTAVFFGNGRMVPLIFSWSQVSEAVNYEIQVAEDAKFSKIIFKDKTDKTQVVLRENFSSSQAYWRVRARNKDRLSPWSSVWVVEVQKGL
jgi:hypothetical protein